MSKKNEINSDENTTTGTTKSVEQTENVPNEVVSTEIENQNTTIDDLDLKISTDIDNVSGLEAKPIEREYAQSTNFVQEPTTTETKPSTEPQQPEPEVPKKGMFGNMPLFKAPIREPKIEIPQTPPPPTEPGEMQFRTEAEQASLGEQINKQAGSSTADFIMNNFEHLVPVIKYKYVEIDTEFIAISPLADDKKRSVINEVDKENRKKKEASKIEAWQLQAIKEPLSEVLQKHGIDQAISPEAKLIIALLVFGVMTYFSVSEMKKQSTQTIEAIRDIIESNKPKPKQKNDSTD